jgi:hypothetical protein
MVVANKTDLASLRQVSTQEGHDFAKRHGYVHGPACMTFPAASATYRNDGD